MIQKAVLIRWMAFGFMAAPVMNLLVVYFATLSMPPAVPGAVFGHLRPLELLEQAMIFLAGLLLFKQHKLRWLVAVVLIFSTVAINLYVMLDSPPASLALAAAEVRLYFSVFLAVCVVLILSYARYPYLDRRQSWLGPIAQRFDVMTPARLFVGSVVVDAETESLSASGCRVRMKTGWSKEDRPRFLETAFPDFGEGKIRAQVVGVQGSIARLKFREFLSADKKAFTVWVQALGEKSVAEKVKFSGGSTEESH